MKIQLASITVFALIATLMVGSLDLAEAGKFGFNKTWDGEGDGSTWSDDVNWSDDTAPDSFDNIGVDGFGFPGDSTVILDIDFTISNDLVITTGDTLIVDEGSILTNETPETLIVDFGATFIIRGTFDTSLGEVINDGLIQVCNDATVIGNLPGEVELITCDGTVAGELLSVDNATLLLAGLQNSAIWMLPVLAGAAGVGAFYLKTRMNKE